MGAEEATAEDDAVGSVPAATGATLHELSSEDLAWRARQGCRASFTELVTRHAPGLQAFLGRRTRDRHEAEDLVQDTFLRAYQNLDRYDRSWRFSTWLFTIAIRLAASHARKKRPCRDAVRLPVHTCGSDEAAQTREQQRSLWALAAELPGGQHQALWLKYGREMSIKEIARAMGRSQVCIKVLLYRARMSLARRLNGSATDAGPGTEP